MISGTSYDGIDAAAADLELDGDVVTLRPLGLASTEWPGRLRARIARRACRRNPTTDRGGVPARHRARSAVRWRRPRAPVPVPAAGSAELIVSHGQTVFHWVEDGRPLGTLQLGAPAWIAAATGLPVVSDLRSRDITRGGHGAPLASTLDAMLLADRPRPSGALNLGGIANITVLGRSRDGGGNPIGVGRWAYDLGPANALIDAAVVAATDGAERMDADGARARPWPGRRRTAEPTAGRALLCPAGSEIDREGVVPFRLSEPSSCWIGGRRAPVAARTGDDLVATLTELSAVLVGDTCREHRLAELVVSGGGVRNPVLMSRIAALAAPTAITPDRRVRVARAGQGGLPVRPARLLDHARTGRSIGHRPPAPMLRRSWARSRRARRRFGCPHRRPRRRPGCASWADPPAPRRRR